MNEVDFNQPFSIETTMEKWNDIVSFNQLFLTNYIFRGQGDSEWPIESTLLRLVKRCHSEKNDPNTANIYEDKMLREFKYKFPLYDSSTIIEDNNVEWLSLMQHYGAPTRLIDFTSSIFVALFFALDGSFDKDSAIWAIRKFEPEKEHVKIFCTENNCSSVSREVLNKYFHERANRFISKFQGKDGVDEIVPIYPNIANKRLAIQQGLFLMSTNLHKPFEKVFNSFTGLSENNLLKTEIVNLLNSSYNRFAKFGIKNLVKVKIIIPRKFKWELTQLLNQMNISAESLYPGLEGMAKSLARLHLRETNLYTE